MLKIKEKIKRSFFVVNKLYLFIIFIFLSIEDFTLAFIYFLISMFIFLTKSLSYKLPMDVKSNIYMETYTYKFTEERDLKLDLYFPNNKNLGKYPLVYFCHGGGWISGFRNQPNNVSWCKFLASKGFIVSSIDYRYGFSHNMDDILSDYSNGLEFLKENSDKFKIDKDNIVLMGLSAGGHLSLLYSSYYSFFKRSDKIEGIKSVIAYYSPTDLKDIFVSDNKSLFAKFAARKTLNGLPTEIQGIYDYYSPINWVSNRMMPTLLVHGKLDNVVPFSSTIKFKKVLEKFNIPSALYVHRTAGHSFDTRLKDLTTIDILEKTLRFIKRSITGDLDDNYRHSSTKKK